MKSKHIKWISAGLIALATTGWAWWQLKPKTASPENQKEISIKQTEIPEVNTTSYADWAGFKFEYPDILTIKEIELDNSKVYSSLEIFGSDGKRLTIRITDSDYSNLSDWQKEFMAKNSVRKIDQAVLADLPALKINYGAPENLLTVAIDSGIIYQIENQADSGFWDRTHQDLTSSWQFTNTIAPANNEPDDGPITLIEETIE